LLDFVNPTCYTGVDIDRSVLQVAASKRPDARFIHVDELDRCEQQFDTIVSIATIGLVPDQEKLLRTMAGLLAPSGRIVLTSPHPRANTLHKIAGRLRLVGNDFGYASSRQLPDRSGMGALASRCGLELIFVSSFMFGLNQLFVLGVATPEPRPT
jgi:SAM-dependent methyltransferase